MPKFSEATIEAVAPKTATGPKTDRKERLSEIQAALADRAARGVALVIELEEGDKPLTIKNRVAKAAANLGITVRARRKGNAINVIPGGPVAAETAETPVEPVAETPAATGGKGKGRGKSNAAATAA